MSLWVKSQRWVCGWRFRGGSVGGKRVESQGRGS